MKPSTELFDLIKSLSKSEKRYFNLTFDRKNEESNYLKLFNEILKQEAYDEKSIKEKFKNEKFVKQLTFTKNYLYNLIIRSLIAYNHDRSIESRLLDSILKIKILYKKALFDQYFSAIKHAKEAAMKYEKFYITAELLRVQRLIVKAEKYRKENKEKLYAEEELNLSRIKNLGQYSRVFAKLMAFMRTEGSPRGKAAKLTLDKIVNTDIMKDESAALSVQALEYFYHIKMIYSSLTGDAESAYRYCRKRLECIEKHPFIFIDDIIDAHRSVIDTLIGMTIRLKKFDEFDTYLEKYKSLAPATTKDKISFKTSIDHITLIYYLEKEDYTGGIKAIPAIAEDLKKFKGKIDKDREIATMFYIAKLYFLAGQFEKALEQTNSLLNNKAIGYREDIQSNVKLVNLLIHYELKNYNLLEYLLESTQRFLNRKGKLYRIETRIIGTLKKLCKAETPEDTHLCFRGFRDELLKLKGDPENEALFRYFDYVKWAESKM
jgi:hypothetical protein